MIKKVLGKEGGSVALILIGLGAGYFFILLGGRFFLVPSSSMEPMLLPNDYIVTVRDGEYRRGDIVVLRDRKEGGYIVKRLIGLAGDRVALEYGALYLNGAYVSEPYLLEPMNYANETPFLVRENEVFVLGDNRNNSEDSGSTGITWPEEDIIGRVVYRYFPYDAMGSIQSYPLDASILPAKAITSP